MYTQMNTIEDILNITKTADAIKKSIEEQLAEKTEKINEEATKLNELQTQLKDAINKGLNSQKERIQAKISAQTKKLDKMKEGVEAWSKKQTQKVNDWMSSQIDTVNAKAKKLQEDEIKAMQADQENKMKKKAEKLISDPPIPMPEDPDDP